MSNVFLGTGRCVYPMHKVGIARHYGQCRNAWGGIGMQRARHSAQLLKARLSAFQQQETFLAVLYGIIPIKHRLDGRYDIRTGRKLLLHQRRSNAQCLLRIFGGNIHKNGVVVCSGHGLLVPKMFIICRFVTIGAHAHLKI